MSTPNPEVAAANLKAAQEAFNAAQGSENDLAVYEATNALHAACAQGQKALGEDPYNEDSLKDRGFIGGDHEAAVNQLTADLEAAQ